VPNGIEHVFEGDDFRFASAEQGEAYRDASAREYPPGDPDARRAGMGEARRLSMGTAGGLRDRM